MQRRQFLKASLVATSYASFFAPSALLAQNQNLISFKQIPLNLKDEVIVPPGYEAKPLISWGDKLFSKALAFDEKKRINEKYIENANLVFGDNTDGMSLFNLDNGNALLVVNNEYINPEIMFNHRGEKTTLNDVLYMQNSVGVSIFEISQKEDGFFKVVLDSPYNRRITAKTPIKIQGPAKSHSLMKTKSDPKGELVLGTINNCANGQTPWGTYLTCEENFNDFFGTSKKDQGFSPSFKRYGLKEKSLYKWELDERFDLAQNLNEPNRFGWVVEIDPFDPKSTPVKRTALGRFKHENAEVVVNKDGRVVVYMGDDEQNEFLYKFVSKNKFNPKNKAANKDLLDSGTLYVARIDGDLLEGVGEWIELSYGKNGLNKANGFNSQAEILINVRLAASFVGATPMDRPEWIAADLKGEFVYATLTNNTKREQIAPANPRKNNIYGQILSFSPLNKDHTQKDFKWSIFALMGNPRVYPSNDPRSGSSNINEDNMFNSPDGLKFDSFGRLWIQSDGKYSNRGDYEKMGNNQMLCANAKTGEIRRFLSGPIACEVTGLAFSKDSKIMFVGIQHPGEDGAKSHFPYGKTPRSTIMQIKKLDGGIIGT
ncbi:PhoX family protein [Campylobacter troglodytis]|uniref:PhoX family protein n=1 Tax=Campylobacter troglodytis TaxID=654363 RepID=UPI00115B70B7|nr:PhoX family phosphatase [Campylobacter troglodytis]TQR59035.1 transcriptional initiation protein Tat [Campylobacter troglodytis]